jgi:riboflavin biosynthesis pyrimidine reductase
MTGEVNFESKYAKMLNSLAENKRITEDQLSHFLKRGIQVISPERDFGLESLGRILPEIVIGASKGYISRMKIPYQSTSYLAANAKFEGKGPYIYKLPNKHAGGITLLSGGKRKVGDNTFASTHRILIGYQSILVSAVNLMINKNKIWNWQFFGDHFKESNPLLYEDLMKLETLWNKKNNSNRKLSSRSLRYVVIARSDATFKKLDIVEEYARHNIAVLDPKNEISVIFLTNQSGYDYASKTIHETEFIDYFVTGKQFDIREAMLKLRKKYDIDVMLNDGGRQMSNSLRDAGLLAEERVTLEPYPGTKIIPEDLDPTSILGDIGLGLDGNEIEGTIMIHSIRIGDERANVYLYPLNETKIF